MAIHDNLNNNLGAKDIYNGVSTFNVNTYTSNNQQDFANHSVYSKTMTLSCTANYDCVASVNFFLFMGSIVTGKTVKINGITVGTDSGNYALKKDDVIEVSWKVKVDYSYARYAGGYWLFGYATTLLTVPQ